MTNRESQIPKRVWRFLARLDLAAVLLLIVLLLAALGSCFPQLAPQVASDPERRALWESAIRTRYGAFAGILAALGFFRWFHSPLFLAATVLLVLVTCACTLERWRIVWRRALCWTRTPCAAGVGDGSPRWSLSALAWCSSLLSAYRGWYAWCGWRVCMDSSTEHACCASRVPLW